jgi:hypothetical protein
VKNIKRSKLSLRRETVAILSMSALVHINGREVASPYITCTGCRSVNVRCWTEDPCANTVDTCPGTTTGV